MSADKTIGEEKQTGRRRRSLLSRNRPEEIEEEEQDELVDERGVTTGKGRVTPGRRNQDDDDDTGNVATRGFGRVREYFDGVRSELQKVVWPTREEAQRLTIIVLVATIASALALGVITLIFTDLFRVGLESPIILLAVMVLGLIGGFFFNRYTSNSSNGRPY